MRPLPVLKPIRIKMMFDKVTIVGVGLIGGSLALALKEKGLQKK